MRKYFLELFAIGLVDSEGRINTEHMTSDALMTSMKTMEELTKMKMDRLVLETTMEMILCMFESSGLKVVLPTDENYFLNNNMSEITDGNYKILGKVVQIYKDSGEISLLRNTVFSKLQLDKMKEFRDVFNDPALADFVGNGGITTTIEAPVIMIIPIAIYV